MPSTTRTNQPSSRPNQVRDGEIALEPAFQDLLRESVRAGWDQSLAMKALIGLAKAKLRAESDDQPGEETEAVAR